MRDHRPRRPFGDRAVVVDVAHHDGRFVAVGSGVWVSDDGLAWTRVEPQIRDAMTVAAGDLGWVVLTENGQLWVSSDAREWDGPHPTPAALRGNLYAGPTRLAVGDDLVIGLGIRDGPVIARIVDAATSDEGGTDSP